LTRMARRRGVTNADEADEGWQQQLQVILQSCAQGLQSMQSSRHLRQKFKKLEQHSTWQAYASG